MSADLRAVQLQDTDLRETSLQGADPREAYLDSARVGYTIDLNYGPWDFIRLGSVNFYKAPDSWPSSQGEVWNGKILLC